MEKLRATLRKRPGLVLLFSAAAAVVLGGAFTLAILLVLPPARH